MYVPPSPPSGSREEQMMSRLAARAIALASRLPSVPMAAAAAMSRPLPDPQPIAAATRLFPPAAGPPPIFCTLQTRPFRVRPRGWPFPGEIHSLIESIGRFRKPKRRQTTGKPAPPKDKELELGVKVCVEEGMPHDLEVLNVAEMLKLNVAMAMKIAFDGLRDSNYKTREYSINDLGGFEKVELSVMLCRDDFIRELNKKWRDRDCTTDVLSMQKHIPDLGLPILMLGDIVISVENAARQAQESGHYLIDEIRILVVRGLLQLLGFGHEFSNEAEIETEKEEELVLTSLGWRGKGMISCSKHWC